MFKDGGNKIVDLCAKFSEVSQSTVGLNRKALLYRINNNGDVFNESVGCIRKSTDALDNVNISDFNCGMVVKELCMVRDALDNVNIRDFNCGVVVKESCTCMVRDKVLYIVLDFSGTIELLTELCIT